MNEENKTLESLKIFNDINVETLQKNISWILFCSFSFALFSFIIGYLLGQKYAYGSVVDKLQEESFADRVNYSLSLMYSSDDENSNDSTEQTKTPENQIIISESSNNDSNSIDEIISNQNNNEIQYQAALSGYGTIALANSFAEKLLNKYSLKSEIIKKTGRRRNGKIVTWYQVSTEKFLDKKKLSEVLEKIKLQEHIKDVVINEHKKGA